MSSHGRSSLSKRISDQRALEALARRPAGSTPRPSPSSRSGVRRRSDTSWIASARRDSTSELQAYARGGAPLPAGTSSARASAPTSRAPTWNDSASTCRRGPGGRSWIRASAPRAWSSGEAQGELESFLTLRAAYSRRGRAIERRSAAFSRPPAVGTSEPRPCFGRPAGAHANAPAAGSATCSRLTRDR